MSQIYSSAEQLVGHTPLVELGRMEQKYGLSCRLLAKLEGRNPGGSVKDRAALAMLEDAERRGLLKPGGTVIEPTSGNTGIALAAIGGARGYRVILVMPDSMGVERQRLLRFFGAELILTPGAGGMACAAETAAALQKTIPGSFIPDQFSNPANAFAHYRTTGPELWADTGGRIDCFVAGVGSGGTVTGTGRYLREQNPAVRIVAVEPAASPLLSQGRTGPHGIAGIGANFLPAVLDRKLLDEIIPVTDGEACQAARDLARTEGIAAGISAGAALHAALALARRAEAAGKTVAVLLPDTGERYLSTPLFHEISHIKKSAVR